MLLIFVCLQRMFLPNVPQPAAQKAAEKEQRDKAAGDVDNTKVDGDPKKALEVAPPPDPRQATEKVVTLGSMDPKQGYRLLVTATTRGGGIERIELVDEKKEDRFRYRELGASRRILGYLGWRPISGGVLITTVRTASPAALATSSEATGGLAVGDVLATIDGTAVRSYDAVQQVLKDIKPGKEVQLKIIRVINGQAQEVTYRTTLSQPPLDVLRTHENLTEQIPGNLQRLSCLTTLASIDTSEIPVGMRSMKGLEGTLRDDWKWCRWKWKADRASNSVCRWPTPLRRKVVTPIDRFGQALSTLSGSGCCTGQVAADADAYSLDFETTVENRGGKRLRSRCVTKHWLVSHWKDGGTPSKSVLLFQRRGSSRCAFPHRPGL